MVRMFRWKKSLGDHLHSEWGITAEDKRGATFPTEDRLQALFKQHVSPDGDLKVIERSANRIVVRIPPHLAPQKCQAFLAAVWSETIFE